MSESTFDFLAHCQPGMELRTRDRRTARITAVSAGTDLISGEVQMLGACAWRGDGRFHEAPAGAAGRWDLMPPQAAPAPVAQAHACLSEAMQSEDNPGCCD
jgi:hypothetical protein